MSEFELTQETGTDGRQLGRLALGTALTVAEAAPLRLALMKALDSCEELVLEAGGVEDVDVAGLQILCAVHRAGVAGVRRIRITGLDAGPWPEVLRICGLSRHEACPASNDRKNCLWL
ncbi:STAS domain-containing protein [Geoalkalibacter halelectricus]|uniref:STAS domain-containing protein n=1 Tax=Geoalkalibacter halelectricus TaxID=2847045 RepID=UPI003D1CB387